jgi:hypothetical protein
MRSGKIGPIFIPVFAVLISLATVSPARADLPLGFQLTGWSTYGDAGSVSVSGGSATINDNTSTQETDLYISFTVPTGGAQSLQFTINSVTADSSYDGGGPPFFGASFGVIDTSQNPPAVSSLVLTAFSDTDSFYTMDVVTDANAPVATPSIVHVSYPAGVFAQVSLDLGSTLDGQSAGILFRLNGGTEGDSGSSVTISNVEIVQATAAAVPEPAPIVFWLTAILLAGVFGVRARRRAAAKGLLAS